MVLRRASFPNNFQMAIGMCCTRSLSERVLIFLTHSLSVSYWPRLTLHDTEPVTRDLTQATLDSIFSIKQLTIIPPMEGKTHWISLQIDLHQQVTLKPRCYCHSDCSCHWFRVGGLWLCCGCVELGWAPVRLETDCQRIRGYQEDRG